MRLRLSPYISFDLLLTEKFPTSSEKVSRFLNHFIFLKLFVFHEWQFYLCTYILPRYFSGCWCFFLVLVKLHHQSLLFFYWVTSCQDMLILCAIIYLYYERIQLFNRSSMSMKICFNCFINKYYAESSNQLDSSKPPINLQWWLSPILVIVFSNIDRFCFAFFGHIFFSGWAREIYRKLLYKKKKKVPIQVKFFLSEMLIRWWKNYASYFSFWV